MKAVLRTDDEEDAAEALGCRLGCASSGCTLVMMRRWLVPEEIVIHRQDRSVAVSLV